MSTPSRSRYLSLAEVAALTGRHPELLRQWCATGRLPCERIAATWTLLETHLPLVQAAPSRGRRKTTTADLGPGLTVVAACFLDANRGRLAYEELRGRFELQQDDAGIAPLTVDALEMVLVAVRVPAGRADEVVQLYERLGGRVVANTREPLRARPESTEGAAGVKPR